MGGPEPGSQNRSGANAKQKLRRRWAPQKPRSRAETNGRDRGPDRTDHHSADRGEEIDLILRSFLVGFAPAKQIVNQNLGVHFFLDVERWRMRNQIRPILLVLAAPHQLRVQVAVASLISHTNRSLLLLAHHRLCIRRWVCSYATPPRG